ncbi:hypothetical protein G6L12_31345 [Agrobacterium rhizogenes]|nr:hypothetical protein [Rhizobium rhizogenes]
MNAQMRPVRAYATYLRAAFLRASARGFMREMNIAYVHARRTLKAFHKEIGNTQPDLWKGRLETLAEEDRICRERDMPKSLGEFAHDPLFGHSIAKAGEVMNRLGHKVSVETEIVELEALFRAACAVKGPVDAR